ncbi:hypothetical protein AXG93_3352s1010 [Marchantia polymorpha subsp. ruderalis]|uniref:Uncharacterized protein n=1 Tax=Marchantia polymorpha subsp. ruderalis TaxID=1480154 RepID=A0A176VDN9_MARPO|nr:hypothetical protein AXG93_3352s1010 [Marchantia polymorpha subsp. ruderalis]
MPSQHRPRACESRRREICDSSQSPSDDGSHGQDAEIESRQSPAAEGPCWCRGRRSSSLCSSCARPPGQDSARAGSRRGVAGKCEGTTGNGGEDEEEAPSGDERRGVEWSTVIEGLEDKRRVQPVETSGPLAGRSFRLAGRKGRQLIDNIPSRSLLDDGNWVEDWWFRASGPVRGTLLSEVLVDLLPDLSVKGFG